MADSILVSYVQTLPLLQCRDALGHRIRVSPDLGLTTVEANVCSTGIEFPGGELLRWDVLEEISATENSCFVLEGSEARKVMIFSELTNRLYSLMPTVRAPTMLVAGIPMHRIQGIDPYRDTLEKIKTIRPVVGDVLDTATGLGYTAIEAAKTADHVITIELDPTALEVARWNPWSRALFDHPKITQRIGDSADVIEEFAEGSFARIIHDPPAFRLAGHLYSGEFYGQLYRVLRNGGRVYHYVGDPESKSGRNITRGVVRRLQEAGFSRVVRRPQAFGVVAFKS